MPKPEARYDGFLPGKYPVTAYGNGGFRFAEMSHRGSLLLLPSSVIAISAASIEELTIEQLERIVIEGEAVELVLVGTGRNLIPLPAHLRNFLSELQLRFEVMHTGAAIRTYNVLLEENRRVAAILIAVE